MKPVTFLALVVLFCLSCSRGSDALPDAPAKTPKGKLFIIGGGDRGDSLNLAMLSASGVLEDGYVAVLPMASSEPDSSFMWFTESIEAISVVPCFNFNLGEDDYVNHVRLDSLKKARLIFICGGDQSVFMNIVRNTPIHEAIREAYYNGATVAGTSAGAAMMSRVMITGDEKHAETYEATYDKIWTDNAIYAEGLGLLDSVIIDQHFVIRSRHNRLLTALCDYRGMAGIGIDESTALLVEKGEATVVGESQVLVFHPADSCRTHFRHLGLKNSRLDVLLPGDKLRLPIR